ncbi:MAG: hypothetical protein V3U65_12380 [Granulosicoccaceae bacterium]
MKIELLLPWLFAEHMPDDSAIDMHPLSPWLAGSAAEQLIQDPYEKVILNSLGYTLNKGDVLPIANCLYAGALAKHQVCAQPVHLDASLDNARLLPAQCLSLTAEESNLLIATLNELWNSDNIHVAAHSAIDWQLTGQNADALDCLPPPMLAYRSVADALPRSTEAAQWRQLLTEAQMMLHEHPVNISRQQRGLRPVNSIWCYGGAAFSKPAEDSQTSLYANDPFAQGLANRLDIECLQIEDLNIAATVERAAHLAKKSNTEKFSKILVADIRLQQAWLANEYDSFIAARDHIIQQMLQPISEAHQNTKHLSFHIDDCHGNRYEPKQASGLGAKLKRVLSKWR